MFFSRRVSFYLSVGKPFSSNLEGCKVKIFHSAWTMVMVTPHRDTDFSKLLNLCKVKRFPLLWPLGLLETNRENRGYFKNWRQYPVKGHFFPKKNCKRAPLIWAIPMFTAYLHCFWWNKFSKKINWGQHPKVGCSLGLESPLERLETVVGCCRALSYIVQGCYIKLWNAQKNLD